MFSALMVNWRSEVNTPLRLNGRTMRSASTPSTESRSTMPSGWAMIEPNRTPLLTRSARTSCAAGARLLDRVGALACRSAVISRASSSTRPAPISAIVCRSLENEGSVESNCALSNPSETKTSVTKSPEPPTTGSLWQPKQELESGPLVRVKAGLTPNLRLVGTIAWVAFGRPAPSSVVNLALNSSRPRSIRAGIADGPAAATASKSRCDGEHALVPTSAEGGAAAPTQAKAPQTAAKTSRIRFMSLASCFEAADR